MKSEGKSVFWRRLVTGFLTVFVTSLFFTNGSASDDFSLQMEANENQDFSCPVPVSVDYSSGFDPDQLHLSNVDVSPDGQLELLTGDQYINPNKIRVPLESEIWCTFLYEGSFYISDFGWMLFEDAVDSNGNFKGWNNIALSKKHPVFINIYDDDETATEWGGGNGVLDSNYGKGSFPTTDETQLSQYDDGSGVFFEVDEDGSVTPRDMKKSLGRFAGGVELVFFLTADKGYDTTDASKVFYTKTSWNPDKYTACTPPDGSDQWISESEGTFNKLYDLGTPLSSESGCNVDGNWLAELAFTRLRIYFGVSLSGKYALRIKNNTISGFPHVIMAAPADDPNQWILGWEDISGGGDADHNDMVFGIERKTGGTAELKAANAITPSDPASYYTSVSIEVYDYIPNTGVCQGQTDIKYYISIDAGATWKEVRDWAVVKESDASKNKLSDVTDWKPGTPEYTYRSARIDFAALGWSGNALLWKAELISNNEACVPRILDVALQGSVATNAVFSRSSPIVQTNVVYSGKYETPHMSWPIDERWLRGHLTATRIYDPANPQNENGSSATSPAILWDAGEKLSGMNPAARKIYFSRLDMGEVTQDDPEYVAGLRGDGVTRVFEGTLGKPVGTTIQASSLVITDEDQREVFRDTADAMVGSWGGTGHINRYTGKLRIEYAEGRAPKNLKKIKAWYSYYTSQGLQEFNETHVSVKELNLDNTYIQGTGYQDDFDKNGTVDPDDAKWLVNWVRGYKDGSYTPKSWLLGAIDHSTPTLCLPPGQPEWYDTLSDGSPMKAAYDQFREQQKERRAVVYVGTKDGMLHAFDAGRFRRGDNPKTPDIIEQNGYFEWTGETADTADYGTGQELWAFIPANLISRLKNNAAGRGEPASVDASPAVADIYADGQWKTVLISAQGSGGDSVFCLDVTDPTAPKFMWEFSDPDLFRSSSSPALAQIAKVRNGTETTWAAFFVSGETTNCNNDIYCYPSVYMIDIADGSLVARVFLDSGPEDSKNGTPGGQPAVVDIDSNGFADRFYVGTDKGYMYRVNIPDDGSTPIDKDHLVDCVVNTSFTTEDGSIASETYQPIYASPTVVVESGVAKIFFGTGDSPYDANDGSADSKYHFFGYEDKSGKGECGDVDLKWFMELPAGERVFAAASAIDDNICFVTSVAETEDPCDSYCSDEPNMNQGKLYVLNREDGSSRLSEPVIVGNAVSFPVVSDRHIYVNTIFNGLKSFGSGQYNTVDTASKIFTLQDAIQILKMLTGNSTEAISSDMDINGDGKVGLEEVVYILRTVSETESSSG